MPERVTVDASAPVLAKIVQAANKHLTASVEVTAKVDGRACQVVVYLREGQIYAVHSPQYEEPAEAWARNALGGELPYGDGEPEYLAYNAPDTPVTAAMIDQIRRDWAYGLLAAALTWQRPQVKIRKRQTTERRKFSPSHWQRVVNDLRAQVSSYEANWAVICQGLAAQGKAVGSAHGVCPYMGVLIPGDETFHEFVSIDTLAARTGQTRAAMLARVASAIASGRHVQFEKVSPPDGIVVPEALQDPKRAFGPVSQADVPTVSRSISDLIDVAPEDVDQRVGVGVGVDLDEMHEYVPFPSEFDASANLDPVEALPALPAGDMNGDADGYGGTLPALSWPSIGDQSATPAPAFGPELMRMIPETTAPQHAGDLAVPPAVGPELGTYDPAPIPPFAEDHAEGAGRAEQLSAFEAFAQPDATASPDDLGETVELPPGLTDDLADTTALFADTDDGVVNTPESPYVPAPADNDATFPWQEAAPPVTEPPAPLPELDTLDAMHADPQDVDDDEPLTREDCPLPAPIPAPVYPDLPKVAYDEAGLPYFVDDDPGTSSPEPAVHDGGAAQVADAPAQPTEPAAPSPESAVTSWIGPVADTLDDETRKSIMRRIHAATLEEVAALASERDRAEQEARRIEAELTVARSNLDQLRAQFESVQRARQDKQAAVDDARAQHEAKRAEAEALRGEHQHAASRVKEQEDVIADLLNRLAQAQLALEQATAVAEEIATQVQRAEADIAATTQPLVSQTTRELARFDRESLDPAMAAVESSQAEVERLFEQHAQAAGEWATLSERVERATQVLNAFVAV